MKDLKDIIKESQSPFPKGKLANEITEITGADIYYFEEIKDKFYISNQRFFDENTRSNYEYGCYYLTSKGDRAFFHKNKTASHVLMEVLVTNGRKIISRRFDSLEETKEAWFKLFGFMPKVWGVDFDA